MDDIAKHSGKEKAINIQSVLNNIPIQLAKQKTGVKKYIFKDVLQTNSKHSTLEGPIDWLEKILEQYLIEKTNESAPQLSIGCFYIAAMTTEVMYKIATQKETKSFPSFYYTSLN